MVATAERRERVVVVAVDGPRLDAVAAPGFRARLAAMIDAGERHILLDLDQVHFIDSSGLGALVGCLRDMGRDGRLELARPREAVRRVLGLTHMDRVFAVRDLPAAG